MAVQSLKRVVEEPATTTEVQPVKEAPLAVVSNHPLIQGEVTSGDFAIPRMSLANKSGELGNSFEPGSYVLDKKFVIGGKDKPVIFTVSHARRLYEEVTDPNEGRMGERVDTSAEVRARGGVLTYGKNQAEAAIAKGLVPYRDVADLGLLIQAPAELPDEFADLFPFEFEGVSYGPALFTCRSGSYNVARDLFYATTSRHKEENGGWTSGDWALTSALVTKQKMSWFTPVLKRGKDHSPEFQAWAKTLIG